MTLRTCRQCGETLAIGSFYKYASRARPTWGRMRICGDCHRANVLYNRAAKADYYRAMDRKRHADRQADS